MKRQYMMSCAAIALLSASGAAQAAADASAKASDNGPAISELIVTAQRRSESIQKVPVTIQAFGGETLSKLNVANFEDILKYTPNVSYANNGPGQGNIFMRGLSAGFAGNQSSATIATFPNVALYLDDQSMQFPSRNVDIYMVDMQRVEVLEGPQGTLFGGGAEAGAVRYITNKPNLSKFQAKAEASYGYTEHGSPNNAENLMVNIPVIQDKFAVRLVAYNDHRGGYIDNVYSAFTRNNNDLGNFYYKIGPGLNGLCSNGLAPGAAGYCALPNSVAPAVTNQSVVQKAQNPTSYDGFRVSAAYQINNDWDVLISESYSNLDAQGVSSEFPNGSDFQALAPYQVTTFAPSYDKDSYNNIAWTVNGKLGDLKAVYTGGYMTRHINSQMDYTNYSRSAGGMYYECVGGSTGWSGSPQCYSPVGYWNDQVRNKHLTQEFRVSTPDTWRIRAIGGVFYEDFKIYDDMNFNYKTIPSCTPANLATAKAGGAACVANVIPAPGSTINNPSVRGDATAFGEDTQRGYNQFAVFGSVDFDLIPNKLTLTAGTRYYRYSEFEVGSQYATVTDCQNVLNGTCLAGLTNIDSHNDHVVYSGFKSRASLTYHVDENTLAYFTFSQGFRPGGFNRTTNAVAPGPDGKKQYIKPNGYAPDSLTNYEIGLKTQLLEKRLLLNLSGYYMQWENVQFAFFNPPYLGNTTFVTNGPKYDVWGLEGQFVARVAHGLTIQGSATYNHDSQTNSPCLIDNVQGTAAFGTCITQIIPKGGSTAVPFTNPFGAPGTTPAFSPEFQGNLRARYEWTVGDYNAWTSLGGSYTGTMYNEPATYTSGNGILIPSTTLLRYRQPGYGLIDASIGVSKDNWSIEVFGSNLNNSRASMFTSSAQFIKSDVPVRPRVIGIKVGASF